MTDVDLSNVVVPKKLRLNKTKRASVAKMIADRSEQKAINDFPDSMAA